MNKDCEFVCTCGKVFTNKRALSGHMANCSDHKELIKKKLEERRLPNGLFKCENPGCPNEHDGSYGSGLFCCKKCRLSFIGKRAYQTKVRNGTFKTPFADKKRAKNNWKCSTCGKIFRTRAEMQTHYRAEHYNNQKCVAWNKGLTKETDNRIKTTIETFNLKLHNGDFLPSFKGKHHSPETKKLLSEKQKENIKCGISHGWLSRKLISFPERFWMRVLDNNSIQYQFQLKIPHSSLGLMGGASYFLDFALPGKVDLEIDGEQHKFRKEYDLKRNKNLEKNGWTIYRIDWNNVTSYNGKLMMKEKIERFLNWYKNFCEIHPC